MNTYGITFWTGAQTTVRAESLIAAYETVYGTYSPENWDAFLWTDLTEDGEIVDETLPYAVVTNRNGDQVCRIAIIAEGDNAESLSGRNAGERERVLQYFVGLWYMLSYKHMSRADVQKDLDAALLFAAPSRKADWTKHVKSLRRALSVGECDGVSILADDDTFAWFIMQHCVIFLGFNA